MTRTTQEDMAPTDEGRHDGRGCYPGCRPRPEGVETEDKTDPYEIGKRPSRSAALHATHPVAIFLLVLGDIAS